MRVAYDNGDVTVIVVCGDVGESAVLTLAEIETKNREPGRTPQSTVFVGELNGVTVAAAFPDWDTSFYVAHTSEVLPETIAYKSTGHGCEIDLEDVPVILRGAVAGWFRKAAGREGEGL